MDLGRTPTVHDRKSGYARFAMTVMGQEETPLSSAFFSKENMDLLQAQMAVAAFQRTGLEISRQSDESLSIIMKAVYGERALNNAHDVDQQVAELNRYVLDICIPQVISGIGGYLRYIKKISTLPVPPPRGENSSSVGTKSASGNPGF